MALLQSITALASCAGVSALGAAAKSLAAAIIWFWSSVNLALAFISSIEATNASPDLPAPAAAT